MKGDNLFGFCKNECQVYLWLYKAVDIAITDEEVNHLEKESIVALKEIKKKEAVA